VIWPASSGSGFRFDRLISPAQKFDSEGAYIRSYVPEADTLAYPAPIVDHARQLLKAPALFKKS